MASCEWEGDVLSGLSLSLSLYSHAATVQVRVVLPWAGWPRPLFPDCPQRRPWHCGHPRPGLSPPPPAAAQPRGDAVGRGGGMPSQQNAKLIISSFLPLTCHCRTGAVPIATGTLPQQPPLGTAHQVRTSRQTHCPPEGGGGRWGRREEGRRGGGHVLSSTAACCSIPHTQSPCTLLARS